MAKRLRKKGLYLKAFAIVSRETPNVLTDTLFRRLLFAGNVNGILHM